jgi:hypothetical protein
MDEHRDDVDTWLDERVQPLLPRPGAFEHIRKRARRRKLGRAAAAGAGVAVVLAAAAAVPDIVNAQLHQSSSATPASPQPVVSASRPGRSVPPSSSPASPSAPAAATSAVPTPMPSNFAVSSVTFVGTGTGWVLGQAAGPSQCAGQSSNTCTSLAGTDDGGQTWHAIQAPAAGQPDGAQGVSQVRSLNGSDGWAFGPELYATHDGGHTWTKIPTHGLRVTDLETVGGRTFAVWANCTGSGPSFAAGCTSFSLYSTPAGADQWSPVAGVTGLTASQTAGQPATASSAQLVLTSSQGYLLAPDGALFTGPATSAAGWQRVTSTETPASPSCVPGPAQADGQPSLGMLAATGSGLVLLCPGKAQAGSQVKTICYSPDGGRTWETVGAAPGAGTATSLSGTPDGRVLVATTLGIYASVNAPDASGAALRWRAVHGASAPGGFSYIGMTTSDQGVAIPADQALHAVWLTYDGGADWRESPVG